MSINKIDDITFWGMNIPQVIENISDKVEQPNMTKEEFQIYKLGVENTISLMKQILDQGLDRESITFYHPNIDSEEEFSSGEIVSLASELG